MKITDTHVYFYSGKEVFSNWYVTEKQFTDYIENWTFDSTEQAFMYCKAQFFADQEKVEQILVQTDPRAVKELGRQVKGYDDKAWECVRLGFMTYVNYLKYSQNEEFKKLLLSTGNKILVEASPYDKIWGVGLGADDPLILDKKNWKGKNLLGVSLMKVRELIK